MKQKPAKSKKAKKGEVREGTLIPVKFSEGHYFDIVLFENEETEANGKFDIEVIYHEKGETFIKEWCEKNKKTENDYFQGLFDTAIRSYIEEEETNENKKRTDSKLSN